MVKKLAWVLVAFVCCGADFAGPEAAKFSKSFDGDDFSISMPAGSEADFKDAAEAAFQAIEGTLKSLSDKNQNSVVSKINTAKFGEVVELDDESALFFKEISRLYKATDGAFDPGTGNLDALWLDAKKIGMPPAQPEIDEALKNSGYGKWAYNPDKKTMGVLQGGAVLSLHRLVLAHAADKAAATLKARGVRSAVISWENGLRFLGTSSGGRFWNVALEHPRRIDDVAASLELDTDAGVVTAGDFQEFFVAQGQRYSCLVDPKTGWAPKTGVLSVTVTSKKALTAEALAQALFVRGEDKGYAILENLKEEGVEAVFISQNPGAPMLLSSSDNLRPALKDIEL